ncbi:BolA/IbaG family iron-sulfur metabolism protein [Thalassotalea litorea]|uniref:DNA-binding transcriptional regulator BolA n=1 Tax=Thalassotalea litorea TaxID=2020715 RepID=A0A5R9IDL9_9GAMM|nr:BolA/IbaG family iron-sulfur metabolism protein [Thalassotalea litorea]TLU61695.1 BolA/IbaG family iron-sulfur metabolism protein [Thalassotalea litorea]
MSIKAQIEQKLATQLSPVHLDVINESYMHNVPSGSESHFKVIVVSEQFSGQRLLQRHRAINAVLADELANHIHALAIHAYDPQQWQSMTEAQIPSSPDCASKK